MNQANTVLGLLETLRELNARNAAQRDRVLNNAFPLMRARIQTLQLAGRENSTDPQTDASLTDALNMFERPNTAPLERFERLGITLGSLITSTSFGQQPKALSLLKGAIQHYGTVACDSGSERLKGLALTVLDIFCREHPEVDLRPSRIMDPVS